MARKLDMLSLSGRLVGELQRRGILSRQDLQGVLEVSQATFSRLVTSLSEKVVVLRAGRETRYALRRVIPGLPERLMVFEVLPSAQIQELEFLVAVEPKGFLFQRKSGEDAVETHFYPDLPYFLNDLKPAGFLGRLVPILI